MNRIYIGILGNPLRAGGGCPLDNVAKPFSLQYVGLPGVARVPYAVEVTVKPDYTLYVMHCNNVTTIDGQQGMLLLGVSIPARYTLAGGRSPLALLLKLRERFIRDFMRGSIAIAPGDPEGYSYRTENIMLDDDYFSPLLMEFPLEPLHAPYVVMSGNDVSALELNEQEMPLFLRDVCMYRELAHCSKVVVASAVNTAMYAGTDISKLKTNIPRRRCFVLRTENPQVVAELDNKLISDGQFEIPVELKPKDADNVSYTYDRVVVHVATLLQGKQCPGLRLDMDNEIIYYTINRKENVRKIQIRFLLNNVPYAREAELFSAVRISLGGQNIPVSPNGQFEVKGARKEYVLNFDTDEFEKESNVLSGDILTVRIRKKAKPAVLQGTISNSGVKNTSLLKIKLTDDTLVSEGGTWVRIEDDDSDRKLLLEQMTRFNNKNETVILLPKELLNRRTYILVHNRSKKTTSKFYVPKTGENEVDLEASKTIPFAGVLDVYRKMAGILLPFVLVILVALGCYVAFSGSDEPADADITSSTKPTPSNPIPVKPGSHDEDEQRIEHAENETEEYKKALNGIKTFLSLNASLNSKYEDVCDKYNEYEQKKQNYKGNRNSEIEELEKSIEEFKKKADNAHKEAEEENRRSQQERAQKQEAYIIYLKDVLSVLNKENITFEAVLKECDEFENKKANEYKGVENGDIKKIESKIKAYKNVVTILTTGDAEAIKALSPESKVLKNLAPAHRYYVLLIYYGRYKTSGVNPNVDQIWKEQTSRWKRNSSEKVRTTALSASGGVNLFINRRNNEYKSFLSLKVFMHNRPIEGKD